MALSNWGTVIKKSGKVISDSWTEQEIILNDNFRIEFCKYWFWVIYNGEGELYNNFSILENKYTFKFNVEDIIFKIKKCKHHDQQFVLWFRFNDDEYKILFGYGVGCDWIDKKSYNFYKRFIGAAFND